MFNFFKKKQVKSTSNRAVVNLVNSIRSETKYATSPNDLTGIEEYDNLKALNKSKQKGLVIQLAEYIDELSLIYRKKRAQKVHAVETHAFYDRRLCIAILSGLLRRNLNYTEQEWIESFQVFRKCSNMSNTSELVDDAFYIHHFPLTYFVKQIETYIKKNEPSDDFIFFLKEVLTWEEFTSECQYPYLETDRIKVLNKLKSLLINLGNVTAFTLDEIDIGSDVNAIIEKISEKKEYLFQICMLAQGASASKPSKKFSDKASKLIEEFGVDAYRKIAHQILSVPVNFSFKEEKKVYTYSGGTQEYTEVTYLCQQSQQFIKGIVWTMERFSDKETIRLLSSVCERSYTKIPGIGPAAASLGNACVLILGNMRGKDGLGALSRLKLKVRQNNVKKSIDKHLLQGAKKYNVSVEELKEMSVPDFQLVNGTKTIDFDDFSLKITIEEKKISQQWIKPDGALMKSVPSAIKNSESLKKKLSAVRKEVKEIQKVHSAQKQRIDNQFIIDRTWDFGSFEKYYLKHGLVSAVAQKLIWTFTKGDSSLAAIYVDNKWSTRDGVEVDWIDRETEVKLLHPVNAEESSVVGWREKMMVIEWIQPIKQAFREIYILTVAEINTNNYSNRMAAHILKQHQFNMLANLRDWKYSLMGAYDDGRDNETCKKYLPEYNITAEYWIDELNYQDDYNDAGIWLYIATDQVKFKNDQGEAIELAQVPKIVFSEIMRDVDMFVGVCSVGNDPEWMDNNGERQENRDYWHSYSFGDLTEIAKTRKSILENLLPRLKKIKDNASIDGKFVKVRGKVRTYKIHIGSGNILMEPNDQYLCIVPSRSAENATDKIFIPFEGDKGLSIVLSKAFLLAEDDKITDRTIISQIKR